MLSQPVPPQRTFHWVVMFVFELVSCTVDYKIVKWASRCLPFRAWWELSKLHDSLSHGLFGLHVYWLWCWQVSVTFCVPCWKQQLKPVAWWWHPRTVMNTIPPCASPLSDYTRISDEMSWSPVVSFVSFSTQTTVIEDYRWSSFGTVMVS